MYKQLQPSLRWFLNLVGVGGACCCCGRDKDYCNWKLQSQLMQEAALIQWPPQRHPVLWLLLQLTTCCSLSLTEFRVTRAGYMWAKLRRFESWAKINSSHTSSDTMISINLLAGRWSSSSSSSSIGLQFLASFSRFYKKRTSLLNLKKKTKTKQNKQIKLQSARSSSSQASKLPQLNSTAKLWKELKLENCKELFG
jgi:hypothetical protein